MEKQMSEKKLTLKIFGQVLNLKSDADPEYAQKLADYVDKQIMKVCLVTICIGERYLQLYNSLFRPSQEKYAKKCGYDFKSTI